MLVNTLERDARYDGWKAGKREGIVEGKSLGLAEGKLETAKNLLQLGLSIEDIAKATGLTVQEIQAL